MDGDYTLCGGEEALGTTLEVTQREEDLRIRQSMTNGGQSVGNDEIRNRDLGKHVAGKLLSCITPIQMMTGFA